MERSPRSVAPKAVLDLRAAFERVERFPEVLLAPERLPEFSALRRIELGRIGRCTRHARQ